MHSGCVAATGWCGMLVPLGSLAIDFRVIPGGWARVSLRHGCDNAVHTWDSRSAPTRRPVHMAASSSYTRHSNEYRVACRRAYIVECLVAKIDPFFHTMGVEAVSEGCVLHGYVLLLQNMPGKVLITTSPPPSQ